GFEITGLMLQRFMPGELPPEPAAPPRPRLERAKGKMGRDGGRDGGRDSRGGGRWEGRGGDRGGGRRFMEKKGPYGRRRHEEEDPEERQRREELADSIGNR